MTADASVMACHGRYVWGVEVAGRIDTYEDEFHMPLRQLESNCAAAMWTYFRSTLPDFLWQLMAETEVNAAVAPMLRMASACFQSDSAAPNEMLIAHAQQVSSDKVCIFRGPCRQHGTGNSFKSVVDRLHILSPEFCLVKRLRNDTFRRRFRDGWRKEILSQLDWIRGGVSPNWRPCAAHVERNRRLLELAYYHRDVRDSAEPGSADAMLNAERMRRERGEAFLIACPGDWRQRVITVWDVGCEQKCEAGGFERL